MRLNDIITPAQYRKLVFAQTTTKEDGLAETFSREPDFAEWSAITTECAHEIAESTGDDPSTIYAASMTTLAALNKFLSDRKEDS
jgi:hypothetical protein